MILRLLLHLRRIHRWSGGHNCATHGPTCSGTGEGIACRPICAWSSSSVHCPLVDMSDCTARVVPCWCADKEANWPMADATTQTGRVLTGTTLQIKPIQCAPARELCEFQVVVALCVGGVRDDQHSHCGAIFSQCTKPLERVFVINFTSVCTIVTYQINGKNHTNTLHICIYHRRAQKAQLPSSVHHGCNQRRRRCNGCETISDLTFPMEFIHSLNENHVVSANEQNHRP